MPGENKCHKPSTVKCRMDRMCVQNNNFLTCLWCETQIFCAFYFQDAEIRVPSTYSEEARIETDVNFTSGIKRPTAYP